MIVEYFRTVLRHRWLIVGLTLVGAVCSLLSQLTTQPVYEARTSIEIQPMNSDFMDARSVATAAALPSDAVLQTQIKLLSSESLADKVKAELRAGAHPEEVVQNDLLSRFERVLHLRASGEIAYDKMLEETARSVKVKPLGISQLIEVSCGSWNPAFAARYCNTLTAQFQEIDLESRGTQAKRISDWLVQQAADVRQKAEDAQRRLEIAAGRNGLLLKAPTNSIGEDRLREMQTELVRAQADRMQKQAELAEAQSGASDGLPDSAAYSASNLRLADLQAQIAAMPNLTESNPKIIHLRSQIAEIQANMQRERTISRTKLQESYQAAKHREDLLKLSYQSAEGIVSSDLQKSSEIEILRREVQSEQQLYQTLLQRAKEAGFASALPASTIRIVDMARVPRSPVYPRRGLTASVGGFIGATLGLIVAFLLERQVPRLRLPGDIDQFIKLDELGVIPSPCAEKHLLSRIKSPVQNALSITGRSAGSTALANTAPWRDEDLVAEAYRSTTFSLLLSEPDPRSRVFVVTSPNAKEGKTTVISNLAIALSKAKLRVVIVDGDLRKPRLHEVMGVENSCGLRNLLMDGVNSYEGRMEVVCKPTAYDNLFVVPSGTGHASISDLLHSAQLDVLFGKLGNLFDVVLVDSPPMLHITDARILAGHASRTILIFRSGVTKRANAEAVRNMLHRDRVRISGCVLNDFNPRREGQGAYYSGYYEYRGTGAEREVRAS
jgi:capsular exopolysaccharide synthesis family protein